MMTVRSGRPACTWATRASFIAESIASEPLPHRNTRASRMGESAAILSLTASAGAVVKGSNAEYASSAVTWAAMASAISRRPCPMAQYQRLAMPSISTLPWSVVTVAPWPLTRRMKKGLAGLAKGCRNGPVMASP
jgi:hypothetical protein